VEVRAEGNEMARGSVCGGHGLGSFVGSSAAVHLLAMPHKA
jgi:hypothetical protein